VRKHHAIRPPRTIALLACAAALTFVPRGYAQSAPGDSFTSRSTLTGDWDGLRTRLKDRGITFNAHYASEGAAIVSGGPYRTGRYTHQLDLETLFDLDKLAGIHDAKVQFTLTERWGRSLTNDVLHNQFSVQELYGAGQNFRLAELNYQQDFDEHRLQIELGWSPLGDRLARLPDFCKFQNGVICGHANAMTTNSGAHNFPTAQWGARITAYPVPHFYVTTGVFQVNPNAGDKDKGFDLSFDSTGVFVPVELGWETGRGEGSLPGDYKLGAYYNSSDTPDVYLDVNHMPAAFTGASFLENNGRYGAYAIASQTVYRPDPDSPRGLRLGAMAGEGVRSTARYSWFWLAGGVWQGTFPGRDHDFIAFMAGYARTNPRLTRYQRERDSIAPDSIGIQTYESVAEVDYGAVITPWLTLRPNLQYIIRPGATGAVRNALVLGLYTQVTF